MRNAAERIAAERIATVDVGTNTALLLVADVGAGGIAPVLEAERFVRLGEGVDATGRVGERAMERLTEALVAFRAETQRLGAERVVVAGTSASRDAANRTELAGAVARAVGWRYEILTGDEEARWSFVGALSAFDDLAGETACIDVGGGSTELVVGTAYEADVRYRCSLEVGSVRLRERLFSVLPPRRDEVTAAERVVEAALDAARVPVVRAPLIGASGTATVLARLHGADRIPYAAVAAWRDRLLAMDADAAFALAPDVMAGRADLAGAAVLILAAVMARCGADALRASPRGLRHGLALRARRAPERG